MSTFATYNTLIEQKIATTSELFFDTDMKRQACNDTVKEILQQYDVPEMIVRATQSFTSGVGTKPSTYFRMVKLWASNATTGVETNEYIYRQPDEFDSLASTEAYWWTEDYNVSAAAFRLLIRPTSVTSLNIRYIKTPSDMSTDAIDCGLSSSWDECIALGTTVKLYNIAKLYNEARETERIYKTKLAQVYQAFKNQGGIKQNNRIKSKFERINRLTS
jgi:hypothetical protein